MTVSCTVHTRAYTPTALMIFADLSVCMYEEAQFPITKAKKADGSEQLFVPRYLSFIKDFGETEETADLSFRMYNPSRLGNPWFMSFSPMPWQTPGTADDEGRLPRYDDTFEDAEAQRQWDSMSSAQKNLYYYIINKRLSKIILGKDGEIQMKILYRGVVNNGVQMLASKIKLSNFIKRYKQYLLNRVPFHRINSESITGLNLKEVYLDILADQVAGRPLSKYDPEDVKTAVGHPLDPFKTSFLDYHKNEVMRLAKEHAEIEHKIGQASPSAWSLGFYVGDNKWFEKDLNPEARAEFIRLKSIKDDLTKKTILEMMEYYKVLGF